MCELNKQINWIPENVKDGQFGKWLENARDWSITRNRFWGAPVPVWRNIEKFKDINFYYSTKDDEVYINYLKNPLQLKTIDKKQALENDREQAKQHFIRAKKYYEDVYRIFKNYNGSFDEFIEKIKQIEIKQKDESIVKNLSNSLIELYEKINKGYSFVYYHSQNKIITKFDDIIECCCLQIKNDIENDIEKRIGNTELIPLDFFRTGRFCCGDCSCDALFLELKTFSSIQELETFFKDDYIADFKAGKNSGKYIKDKNNPEGSFKIDDLHRPYIDELVKHTDGGDLKRVEDVLDCWFESGSMPYAQVHYPFEYRDGNGNLIRTKEENEKWFNSHFPCDFVTEYVAQTRGWFYTMVVLATALFDKIPFKNVICHGVMLDINGQKLSKRLRNYPDPLEMIDIYGSDAMRWLMASSPVVQGGDMRIDKDGKMIADVVKNILNPIWNAFMFYKQYAELDKIKISGKIDSKNVMDVYILSKLKLFVEKFENAMDKYNTIDACHEVELFIESLNNWYIRRNKERFWRSEHDENKQQAYETLHFVLKTFATTVAPVLPFLCEKIYQDLIEFEDK